MQRNEYSNGLLVGAMIMACIGAVFTSVYYSKTQTAELNLRIAEAKHDTGICGTKQMVLIDENTVVLGGYPVAASFLDRYTFVTTPDGQLRVLFEEHQGAAQKLIMERPAKR